MRSADGKAYEDPTIFSAAIEEQQDLLATVERGRVTLWKDWRTGNPTWVTDVSFTGDLQSPVFDRTGRHFAVADDKALAIYDVQTREAVQTPPASLHPVDCLALNDPGTRVAGQKDGRILILNVTDLKMPPVVLDSRFVQNRHRPEPNMVGNICLDAKFSHDSKRLAAAIEDAAVIFDLENRGDPPVVLRHSNDVITLDWSADSKLLATGTAQDDWAHIWDVERQEEVSRLPLDKRVEAVSFSPVGGVLATASETAKLWRMQKIDTTTRWVGTTNARVLSPKGNYVAVDISDCLYIYRTKDGSQAAVWRHDGEGGYEGGQVGFNREETRVWLSNGAGTDVWSLTSPDEPKSHLSPLWVNGSPLSADGKVAVINTVGGIDIVNSNTNALLFRCSSNSLSFRWISPAGDAVVSADGTRSNLCIGGKQFPLEATGYFAHWSNDSSLFEIDDGSGIWLYERSSGHLITKANAVSFTDAALSPHSKAFAAITSDQGRSVLYGGGIWFNDDSSGHLIGVSEEKVVSDAAFSPHSKAFAAITSDQGRSVLYVSYREQLTKPIRIPLDYMALSVAFSEDDRYLAVVSELRFIDVFDVRSHKVVAEVQLPGPAHSAVFNENDKYLVVLGTGQEAWKLMWQTDDLKREACNRVTLNLSRADVRNFSNDPRFALQTCPNLPANPNWH